MTTCRRLLLAAATVALLAGRAPAQPAGSGCKPSEFRCASSRFCIAQDKFCDGENDCEDKSDEPVYCTPCNRTLFGDVGRTYELQVRRPREERLPFLCHINFTAAGQELGDLVQLTFDTFTVGRFLSFTSEGCPDGYMTIREENRPATGGQWCGSAWGYTVYYSETRSINLTLYLSRLSGQGNDYNFDFKLSYKFLKRSEAHLRYGNSSLSTWRGELVNATYCDRVFTRCDTRACRLQSPNYPGVYPRNVTCYYRVEQKRAPLGQRALLAVSQRNSHKIHIKDQVNKYDTSQRSLRVWDQCNVVQDYLTVYDGGSTTDRVLVRLCGGDAVPDIVGSRDTMLLEFHTSPYDNPFHPVPLSFLPGFELEVQVIFVDERSSASFVVKDKENCDFYISSYESSSGVLENPKHSLPPNTTCRYHFQGKPGEIVWLAFVKYYAATSDPVSSLAASDADTTTACNVQLLIWNGERKGKASQIENSVLGPDGADPQRPTDNIRENATLMGEFCKDEIPRLCDHSLLRNGSRHTRPCSMTESYVSSGRHLTLEHVLRQGSALYPVSFVVRYEFVREPSSCNRIFVAPPGVGPTEPRAFGSPRSVFFYGRGGAANLSCVYRFETGFDKRLEITIIKASFGGRKCRSVMDPLVSRWSCERPSSQPDEGLAELRVAEYPWPGIHLPRDCLCSNLGERLVFQSLSSTRSELSFVVRRMNVTQDYLDFYFEGEYRFVPADQEPQQQQQQQQQQSPQSPGHSIPIPICHGSSHSESSRLNNLDERRLRGTSGEISLRSPSQPSTTSVAPQTSDQHLAMSAEGAARRDSLRGLATVDQSLSASEGLVQDLGSASTSTQRGSGTSASEVTRCLNEPWLIEPEDTRLHFLYLKTPGFRLTRRNFAECRTRNRIIVYPAADAMERTVICPVESNSTTRHTHIPESSKMVEMVSGGWNHTGSVIFQASDGALQPQQHSRSFVLEFLQQEPGQYLVTWMAISKRLFTAPSDSFFGAFGHSSPICPYRCPELEACISSMLWCDGVKNCPSGFDEREDNCAYRFGLTLLYVAVGAGALGIFLIFLLATGCLKYCIYRRRRLQRRHLQKKIPAQTDEQQRLQKKKVHVLSVNHLNSPSNHASRNNGTLETGVLNQQPRYANATFARIGRYDPRQQEYLHRQQNHLCDDPEDEEDDYASKYAKDSIC